MYCRGIEEAKFTRKEAGPDTTQIPSVEESGEGQGEAWQRCGDLHSPVLLRNYNLHIAFASSNSVARRFSPHFEQEWHAVQRTSLFCLKFFCGRMLSGNNNGAFDALQTVHLISLQSLHTGPFGAKSWPS